MPLFEVALILKPTKKQSEEGMIDTLILAPTAIMAANDKAAGLQAVLDNKDKLGDLSRVEVLLRPFA